MMTWDEMCEFLAKSHYAQQAACDHEDEDDELEAEKNAERESLCGLDNNEQWW